MGILTQKLFKESGQILGFKREFEEMFLDTTGHWSSLLVTIHETIDKICRETEKKFLDLGS